MMWALLSLCVGFFIGCFFMAYAVMIWIKGHDTITVENSVYKLTLLNGNKKGFSTKNTLDVKYVKGVKK